MRIGVFFDHLRTISDQLGISLEAVVRLARELGIAFVHMDAAFWMANEKRVDEMLNQTGLKVGAAHLVAQLTQNQDMDKVEQAIRFLSRKGVKHLLLIPGFVHPAQSRQAAMEQAALHLREAVYLARSLHVCCSLEDYGNANAPFGRWQELQWFAEQVPGLGITLDTGNFAFWNQNAHEACEHLAGYICMVHAKDHVLNGRPGEKSLTALDGKELYPCAVGSGIIPMQEIAASLRGHGYAGDIVIEHFDSADMMGDLRSSVAWLKERWKD